MFRTTGGTVFTLILCGLIAHCPALNGSFKTMDDEASIVQNDNIKSFVHLPKIFTSSFFGGGSYYRPLVSLTHMAEYRLFGLNPFSYNLTNLLLHLACAVLVFFITDIFLERRHLALAAAMLFAVHPIHWEAVANIAGRSILLCGFWYLAAFLFYIRGIHPDRRRIYRGLSLTALALALLSKEAAAVFPLLIVCYEFLFHREFKRQDTVRKVLVKAAPFLLLAVVYGLLRTALAITNIPRWTSPRELLLGVMTFLRAVLTYARLFIFPVDLHFDRARPYFTAFTDAQLWLTLIVFFALAAAGFKFRRRLSAPVKFFLAWFGLALLPVAQLVPLRAHAGFAAAAEHFLYLPSVGVFVLLSVMSAGLLRRARELNLLRQPVIRFVVGGFFIFLILVSIGQNLHAARQIVMFEKSLYYNPQNTRVRTSYALALAKHGLFKESEKEFRKVLVDEPLNVRARVGLGKALCDQGRYLAGIQEYEKITHAGALSDLLQENLEKSYAILIRQYLERIAREPGNAQMHYSLGVVYTKQGRLQKALEEYEQAIALAPDHRAALFNAGQLYRYLGKSDKAAVYLEKVNRLK